jgi:hypothetical protein
MSEEWVRKADPRWLEDTYRRVVSKRPEIVHPNEHERGQAGVDAAHEAYVRVYDSATAAEHVLDNSGLVSLSAEERSIARACNLTDAEYAVQKVRRNNYRRQGFFRGQT